VAVSSPSKIHSRRPDPYTVIRPSTRAVQGYRGASWSAIRAPVDCSWRVARVRTDVVHAAEKSGDRLLPYAVDYPPASSTSADTQPTALGVFME